MDEGLLDAPSVFGHYSALYRIPKSGGLAGPEFQIYSASDAVNRVNFFYGIFYASWPINPLLQPYVNLAASPAALVNAIDRALLFGRMSAATRTAILNQLLLEYDANARTLSALFLAVSSGEAAVQR
jgi:hypothetical protein